MNASLVLVDVAVKDLSGAALNWAVAQVVDYKTALEGNDNGPDEWIVMGREDMYLTRDPDEFCVWSPSTDWSQGGPLIDKYIRQVKFYAGELPESAWRGETVDGWGEGPTPLIAACRAIVAAKLGDIVKVPACLVR
ncbi:DUF2591 domain-containing protein [Pseudomonas sp. SWRI74]|uniref:DUF2591 domain-containing protein n=1 Tax=Pseudomonas azerbaijanoccidentalis TaxID=2842347 RepID=A0ABS6R0L0_9PSED|nr:phage protein NinX family protein [Pseudomonas azerbaijanoccidentalis]MBV4524346.1 DUF2591 domain-containing protein [Pseudomonas azerbaijanoccidentalis]